MWTWILIGLNIITKVHGFSNGNFPESCNSLSPQHGSFVAKTSTAPFKVDIGGSNPGDPITVVLRSTGSTDFRGFMMEARGEDSDTLVGTFISLDASTTRLLTCNGATGSAVSQRNNQRKREFRVNWTAPEINEDIVFRATFVQDFVTFWENVRSNFRLTTATPAPSTTTTAPAPSTTTTAPAPSTTTTAPAPSTTTTAPTPSTIIISLEPSTTTNTPEQSTTTNTPEQSTTTNTPEQSTTTITPAPGITTNTPEQSTTTNTQEQSTTTNTQEQSTSTNTPAPAQTPAMTPGVCVFQVVSQASLKLGVLCLPTHPPPPQRLTTTAPAPSTTTTAATPNTSTSITPTHPPPPPPPRLTKIGTALKCVDLILEEVKVDMSNIFAVLMAKGTHRCCSEVSKTVLSILCLGFEIASLILFAIESSHNEILVGLVCVVIVINFTEQVIWSLTVRRKLEQTGILAGKVCFIVHQSFTIAVFYVSVSINCGKNWGDSWPLKVLIALTVWIFLTAVWILGISTTEIQEANEKGPITLMLNSKENPRKKEMGSPELQWRRATSHPEDNGSAKDLRTTQWFNSFQQNHSQQNHSQPKQKKNHTAVKMIVSLLFIIGTTSLAVAVIVGIFLGCQEN